MTHDPQAIGILDSGVGGLTVVREVMRQLPQEKIVYFGDTLRCPYGPRPPSEVQRFTLEIVRFLSRFPLKALVIACNTATAVALVEIEKWVTVPFIGVIDPGTRSAIKSSKHGRIGVIGTEGTIRSGSYERSLKRINPDLYVVSLACPTFVPIVEYGQAEADESRGVVEKALAPLQVHKLDTLILGCTHYPLLFEHIAKVVGSGVGLISSAEETARELSAILHHRGLLSSAECGDSPQHQFFTSGEPTLFHTIASRWLQYEVRVEHVQLQQLA